MFKCRVGGLEFECGLFGGLFVGFEGEKVVREGVEFYLEVCDSIFLFLN